MQASDYERDLEYLYSALLKHPGIIEDEKAKAEFEALYVKNKDVEFEYDTFIDAATELTMFFGDGHTNIEIPYTEQDMCLKLRCFWNANNWNELILNEQYEDIPVNAKIICVEEMTIEELIRVLAEKIPHENIYLVKSRMIIYPYQNYHMFSEMNLKKLFGSKKAYSVLFDVNGTVIQKDILLTAYDGFLDSASDDEFLSYEVDGDTVILHLNACICNERYKQTLETLAKICAEQKISSFVLDLSENMGGDSSVIDEFIKYTKVKNYRRYEMIDYSSGEARTISSRKDVVENQQKGILFPENIICKVSHNTFSSARTFAVTLKDNGIAKICGSETGGKPNSYGMPKRMCMPNTNIRFRVSRASFLRPEGTLDDEITLVPEE